MYYAIAETLGGDYLRYPGNNERFFLRFLLLIILSWTIAVRAWSSLDATPPMPARWLLRGFGTLSVLAGALLGLAWIIQLVPIALSGVVGPEYLDSPSAFWSIRIVDLGFIVPIAVWTGAGLWRQQAMAIRAASHSLRLDATPAGPGRSGTDWQRTATCPSTRIGQHASHILHQGEFPVFLQIDEREHQLLLDVLGSAMQRLREIDTAGYEAMQQEREAVMLSLRKRLVARASGVLGGGSEVRRVLA